MKFILNKENLLDALNSIQGVVEKRGINPILSNVLFSANDGSLSLTTTDTEVELHASFETGSLEPVEITLPCRKLTDICKALPKQADIAFSIADGKATLTSGRSLFSLATLPAADFPRIPFSEGREETLNIPSVTFKKVIDKTFFSMALQDVRYYLNGLYFSLTQDKLLTVTTDGHRLSLCTETLDEPCETPVNVIIPRKGAQEILRLLDDSSENTVLRLIKNHLCVEKGRHKVITKLIDAQYPDYEKVIPAGGNKHLSVEKETLKQSLHKASILSNEKYKGVRLSIGGGTLEVTTHNPEHEEAKDEIDVNYQGESISIGFNVVYLLDILNVIDGDEITMTLKDENSSCLITSQSQAGSQYVVMPMRL